MVSPEQAHASLGRAGAAAARSRSFTIAGDALDLRGRPVYWIPAALVVALPLVIAARRR